MSRTRPTTEQVRFRSTKSGEHVLDTYMEAAELGGRTLSDLLQDVFQETGAIRQDLVEWRLSNGTLQTRVGDYVDANAGWRDVSRFFAHRGNFATGTLYQNYETVTVADGSLHLVNGLTTPTSYPTEAAFKLAHARLINTAVLDNYITTANGAATAANTAKTDAETARTGAQTARTGAETARDLTLGYRNTATGARDLALQYRDAALGARDTAVQANTDAQAAKTDAQTAQTNAAAARTGAETARTGAQTARTGAETARDKALEYRNDAQAALATVNGVLGDVATTGTAQTITAAKTFSIGPTVTSQVRVAMTGFGTGNPDKELFYGSGGSVGIYDRTNNRWDLQIDPSGNLFPRGTMDASNLSGLVHIDRIPSTVVKTSGPQTIAGEKTFDGQVNIDNGSLNVRAAPAVNKHVWFRDSDGTVRGIVYQDAAQNSMSMAAYNNAGGQVCRITLMQDGDITAGIGRFAGSGAGLTNLNASSLGSGTVPNARMVGDYSWNSLDLGGRLLVTGSNTWEAPGVQINGTSPNIHFRQGDGNSAIVGTNATFFYVLADKDSNGAFETVPLAVSLDGAGITHYGTQLAYATTQIIAGNGLNLGAGGTLGQNTTLVLGTPSAITATSTNSVTAGSHTHAITEGTIRTLIADGLRNGIGTYVQAAKKTAGDVAAGATVAGSALAPASDGFDEGVGALTGTWRCMGHGRSGSGTLWLRIN